MKRGQLESWEEQNPTLADGEIGFARDLNRIKIGDGQASWNELDYLKTSDVYIGDNTPEDEAIQLWIKPTKENEEEISLSEKMNQILNELQSINERLSSLEQISNSFQNELENIIYGTQED